MNHSIAAVFLLIVGSRAQAPPAAVTAANPTCPKETGGSCKVMKCHPWRNAQCVGGKCVCGSGTCAYGGRCDTASDKKRAEVEEDAQKAIAALQNMPQREKVAAKRVAAQKTAADNAVKHHKESMAAAAQENEFRIASQKATEDQTAARKNQEQAAANVAAATADIKTGSPEAEVAFGKAQGDKKSADAWVQKATRDIDDANKAASRAETAKDDLAKQAADEEMYSTKCESDTGGSCNAMPCHSWRNAQCVSVGAGLKKRKHCLCSAGQCAFNGVCVPADSISPFEPAKRNEFVKNQLEKEVASDKAALKTSESSTCEKDTKHACILGTCIVYDAWGTATCVNGSCQCSKKDACVIQGKCAHWTTSADLGADVKLVSKPRSSLPMASLLIGALGVIGAFAFRLAARYQNDAYSEPLLELE